MHSGGGCYGYANASDTKTTQAQTDSLLAELTQQIVLGFPGPAFVAGDFNQTPGILHDIQTWADEMFGIPPGPTCQYTTRKDFVFLSPQLQSLMKSCLNNHDKFPDHSTLVGMLSLPSKAMPIAHWKKAVAIDYSVVGADKIASEPCPPFEDKSDPTEQYASICEAFEHHVHRVRTQNSQTGLNKGQRGRGQTLSRTFIQPRLAKLKPGRPGDVNPDVNSWSLLHCRWVTQCRRLDNYVKHVRKSNASPTAIEQRASLWRAIRQAAGFNGDFSTWWQSQAMTNPNMLPWMPVSPPALDIAIHIQTNFSQYLTSLEKDIMSKRIAQAQHSRRQDVNRVFKYVRKPTPVPVHMLVAKAKATITEIVDEGSVIVDDSSPIQHASTLETRTGPMHVLHVEEQQVWFTSPHQLQVGDDLAIVDMRGQDHEIHAAFLEEWTKRWDRHRHLEPGHWDEILSLTRSLLQFPDMKLRPITLQRWKAAVRSKKASSATGLDSLSRLDLLAFPDSLHEKIIQLLSHAEATGEWPRQLVSGSVHALQKTPQAESVQDYRPITIMPLCYRIYSSLRAREILQHLQHHVPPTLLGNIPGRHAASLWWTMQHRIEMALQDSRSMGPRPIL